MIGVFGDGGSLFWFVIVHLGHFDVCVDDSQMQRVVFNNKFVLIVAYVDLHEFLYASYCFYLSPLIDYYFVYMLLVSYLHMLYACVYYFCHLGPLSVLSRGLAMGSHSISWDRPKACFHLYPPRPCSISEIYNKFFLFGLIYFQKNLKGKWVKNYKQ